MTARRFVKIRRNAEWFWCAVERENDDGSVEATVANDTITAGFRLGDAIHLPADETVVERRTEAVH